jgi:hypothetical protein
MRYLVKAGLTLVRRNQLCESLTSASNSFFVPPDNIILAHFQSSIHKVAAIATQTEVSTEVAGISFRRKRFLAKGRYKSAAIKIKVTPIISGTRLFLYCIVLKIE